MAVTHATAIRNVICNAAVDQLDVGSLNASGRLRFRTVASATVATLPMAYPAFGAAASGVAAAGAITSDTAAAGGTIDNFVLLNRDEVVCISGSVTVSGGGGDIEFGASVVVAPGDTVAVTELYYEAAP